MYTLSVYLRYLPGRSEIVLITLEVLLFRNSFIWYVRCFSEAGRTDGLNDMPGESRGGRAFPRVSNAYIPCLQARAAFLNRQRYKNMTLALAAWPLLPEHRLRLVQNAGSFLFSSVFIN